MTVVIEFKDGECEYLKGVRQIEDVDGTVEIVSGASDITRYKDSEIRKIELIWQ